VAPIAFLGTGQMGEPMARRLLDSGNELVVWNRTPAKADELVAAGAQRAETPAEAVEKAEVAITMVASPEAVKDVLFGSEGAASRMAEGATLIEMSTIGREALLAIGSRLSTGIRVLDAPVLGSIPQATDGSLQVFVGGDEATFDAHRELLSVFGTPRYMGPLGAGAAMKLVVNSILGAVMSSLGEALALGDAFGLSERSVLDALEGSPVGVTVKRKRSSIETDTYAPSFKLSLAVKDLDLVEAAAQKEGLNFKLAPGAKTWYEAADEAGLGDCDYSAVIAHIRGRPARP
jgi:3-hydroxyisobutyrate dehydrogenase-like beta-hydroxyacid dehydrogenase